MINNNNRLFHGHFIRDESLSYTKFAIDTHNKPTWEATHFKINATKGSESLNGWSNIMQLIRRIGISNFTSYPFTSFTSFPEGEKAQSARL
jgi:hypothetical protein